MSTAISTLYEPLRHVLGDRNSDVQRYADSALLAGVQCMINMGKLEDFALTADTLSVTPSITDPNDYALLLLETALSFVASEPDGWAFRTRAISKSTGGYKQFIYELKNQRYELQIGTVFSSWQTFGAWSQGVVGVDLGAFLTPVTAVNLLGGISISAT